MPGTQDVTVDRLIAAVKQLPPAKLSLFSRRFSAWREKNQKVMSEETALIAATHLRLSPPAERRLKRLAEKSERGLLKTNELEDYRRLSQQAEQLNARRVEALAKLAHRWGKPLHVVIREIGWGDGEDGATRPSTRHSSSRA